MKKALALVLAFLMCLSIVVVWSEKSQATEEPSKTTETNRGMTIGAGRLHTVALLVDGTVVIAGDTEHGQGDGVEDWKDIIAVSASFDHTVGLKADGTVVDVGNNGVTYPTSDVSGWTDIVAIWAGYTAVVGLKADGTWMTTGLTKPLQDAVATWINSDIVAIAPGVYTMAGLKADGTVVAAGDNYHGECEVSDWQDIIAVATGYGHTVGLKADGTVIAVGDNEKGQCNVADWTDIVAIAAYWHHTVGLKADGTVVAVGDNEKGQCNVADWTDIVAIAAGYSHTVGLKSDGTMVAVGDNEKGQCDVSGWKDIRLPERKEMEWTLGNATEAFVKNIVVPENAAQYRKVLTVQLTEEQAAAFKDGMAFICVPNVLAGGDEKAIQGIAYLPVELTDDNKLKAEFSGLYVSVEEKPSENLQAQLVTTRPILMSFQNSLDDAKASLALNGVFYGIMDVMYNPFIINVDYANNTAQIESISLNEPTKEPRSNGYYSSYRYTYIMDEAAELPHFIDMKSTSWTLWYEKKIDAPKTIVLRPVSGSGCMVLFSITNKDGTRYSLAPVNYD